MKARLFALMTVLPLGCTTMDDSGDSDAGVDRFAGYGEPIAASAAQWSWVPFEGARCGNGSAAGIGINPSEDGDSVLFYLEGGGLCWDDTTCNQQKTALFVDRGFNSADLQTFADELGDRGLFNRADPNNPFRDYSYVYVPYCTGDLHGGSRAETNYGVQHVGYDNIGAYLHRVVPTFPSASRVVVAGASAGGYGAMLNYDRVTRAFIDVPTDLLLDSSPPFPDTILPPEMQQTQREAWNLDAAIPAGCESCDDLHSTFTYLLDTHREMRVGLISSVSDQTLRYLIGLGAGTSVSAQQYQDAVFGLMTDTFVVDRTRVYLIPGGEHVFLYSSLGAVVVSGEPLGGWIEGFLGAEPWTHVFP